MHFYCRRELLRLNCPVPIVQRKFIDIIQSVMISSSTLLFYSQPGAWWSCDGQNVLPEHFHSYKIQYQPNGDQYAHSCQECRVAGRKVPPENIIETLDPPIVHRKIRHLLHEGWHGKGRYHAATDSTHRQNDQGRETLHLCSGLGEGSEDNTETGAGKSGSGDHHQQGRYVLPNAETERDPGKQEHYR